MSAKSPKTPTSAKKGKKPSAASPKASSSAEKKPKVTHASAKAEATANVAQKFASAPENILVGSNSAEGASSTNDIRHALSSLYSVSTKMHRPGRYEHRVKHLLTGGVDAAAESSASKKKAAAPATASGITSEQIWGQLNTLSMPVLSEASKSISAIAKKIEGIEEHQGRAVGTKTSNNKASLKQATKNAQLKKVFQEEDFEGAENVDKLDAELEAIDEQLAEQYRRQKKEVADGKGKKGGNDDWRYAFGKNGDHEELSDEDDDGSVDENGEKKVDLMMGLGGKKAKIRGRTIGQEDENNTGGYDDDEEDEDSDDDMDEELTAAEKKQLLAAHRGSDDDEEDFDDDEEVPVDEEGDDEDFDDDEEGEQPDFDDDRDLFGDGEDDENDAVMAELYGDGAVDMDDDDEEGEEFEDDFGKLGRQMPKRKRQPGDEDFDDEEDNYTDDDFEDDLASRDEAEGIVPTRLSSKQKKKVTFGSDDDLEEGGPAGSDDEFDGSDEEDDANLTAFERAERDRKKELKAMEEDRLFNKDWAMQGEVSGSKRPRDSLIEETVDFDHAMKTVPVVTEHMTQSIEERIKKRIQTGNFDDVERRAKMTTADDLVTTKKDTGVESEKSKMSLMDLYEKDYLEKMKAAEAAQGGPEAAEPLTEVERDELKAVQMWKRINQHLDALSNFFFTPKPTQGDLDARVRAVSDAAPAITFENVGNAAVSREAAVAPQDLYRPKDNRRVAGVSLEEMDPREKRAMRRAKKDASAVTKERRLNAMEKNAKAKKMKAAAAAAASAE